MKRLLALVGAAATACGLYAADYAISFEREESDQGVDTEAMTFTPGDGWAWECAETLSLVKYGEGEGYEYGTESLVRRTEMFTSGPDNFHYLKLDTGTNSLVRDIGTPYLDQLVKFTGFEEVQTNLVEGTKIAVWMSEFTEEDNTTSTNLYVTAGKIDSTENAVPVALKIGGEYQLDTWYRLTVKSLGNVFAGKGYMKPRAGFVVYIDGNPIAISEDADRDLVASASEMTDDAQKFYAQGMLFPSLIEEEKEEGAMFKQVAYQGIGSVDDIIIDSKGPAFCVNEDFTFTIGNVENAEVAEVVANGITLAADPEGKYTVQANAQVVINFKAFDGYKLKTDTMEVTISKSEQVVDPSETIEAVPVVAVLNDEKELAEFELYDVFAALGDGDSIEILDYCQVFDGDEQLLYEFDSPAKIEVADGEWAVDVFGDGGTIQVGELPAGRTMTAEFEDSENGYFIFVGEELNGQLFVNNGMALNYYEVTLGEAGLIQAANFMAGAPITLTVGAKVITQIDDQGGMIIDVDGNAIVPTEADGWCTFEVSTEPPEPTAYTITYHDYGEWADGFEPVTEYTEETDTFALPVAENIAPRMGGEFQGWTNAVGAIVSEVEKGSEGDLNFYAVWKTAGTDEVAEEIAEKVETEGMSEDAQKTVRANIIELNEACGGIDAAKSWIANVYGEGAKIPGAKLVATTPELINIAAKYDLPIMTTEVAVEVGQADDGAFTFKLNDGGEDISIARAKIEEMIQYSADLVNFAVNKEQIEVVVDKDNCTMKATFKKLAGEAKGFMKLVLEADK